MQNKKVGVTLSLETKKETPTMPYTSNPYAPKARMIARNDVLHRGLSMAEAGRKYGVTRSAVWKWMKKAKERRINGNSLLWTQSSAPYRHPNMLKPKVVNRIIELRQELKRCAPVIHQHLKNEGFTVSLSSVERLLRRLELTRKKRQAVPYMPIPRPDPLFPGALVEVDTIHFVRSDYSRCYVYAVIDVYSRLGYAEYHQSFSHKASFEVILNAEKYFGFKFKTVQTDNGPEFSESLWHLLRRKKIVLRHSRVRKPNDNAHVERFIRTIQEECFGRTNPREETVRGQLKNYILYYNERRLHLSLNLETPTHFVSKVLT